MILKDITHRLIAESYFSNRTDKSTEDIVKTCEDAPLKELKEYFNSLDDWGDVHELGSILTVESDRFVTKGYALYRDGELVADLEYHGTTVN
jgi:hypothetical protein